MPFSPNCRILYNFKSGSLFERNLVNVMGELSTQIQNPWLITSYVIVKKFTPIVITPETPTLFLLEGLLL